MIGGTGAGARVRLAAALWIAVCLFLCVACTRRTGADRGGVARRIVSLSPSTTEALYAIGAGAALVGRSRYCDYPPEVARLPEVGGYVDPNFEAVLALTPDLVTGARGPSGTTVVDRLGARGIATYFPETESLAGIETMIVGLGERTGHEPEARAVVAHVEADVGAVERAAEGQHPTRVMLLFGLEPIVAAGPGSYADDMLRRAGGTNVVTEGGRYPTLGMERVLALDPDVVVDATMGESHDIERITAQTAGWRDARAVKSGRVVPLHDEVVLRPGPRVAQGLWELARVLHPALSLPEPRP